MMSADNFDNHLFDLDLFPDKLYYSANMKDGLEKRLLSGRMIKFLLLFLLFTPLSAGIPTGVVIITSSDSLLPVYIDDVFIGYTPLEHAIVVSEGWHTVGIFRTVQLPGKTPPQSLEKTTANLINSGIGKVYVPSDEVVEVQLSRERVTSEITRKSVKGRNLIIISLALALVSIIIGVIFQV